MAEHYPNAPWAKAGSPQTAFDAAESMTEAAASIRALAFALVKESGPNGMTGDDVADRLGLHVAQVRSRLSELHAASRIVESGRTRLGKSGRQTTVWVLPEYGPQPSADQANLPGIL